MCCVSCCLACLDRLLNFLVCTSYIMVAIKGSNFCASAKTAFGLLASNVLRLGAVHCVADLVIFLGKIFSTSATVVAAYFWVSRAEDRAPSVFLLIAVGLLAFVAAVAFMYILEVTVDTIFLCVLYDLDVNDGVSKPYHMRPSLASAFSVHSGGPIPSSKVAAADGFDEMADSDGGAVMGHHGQTANKYKVSQQN